MSGATWAGSTGFQAFQLFSAMIISDAFGRFHPIVNFAYFAFAIAVCVMLRHPAAQLVSVVLAIVCFLSVGGALKPLTVLYLAAMFSFVVVLNPVFNTMGETVLFTYLGGRAFTGEALAFGISSALMFVGMLIWFFAFNLVVGSDKLTYLFGWLMPAISLVLVMALRLLPQYRMKLNDFSLARRGLPRIGSGRGQAGLKGISEALVHISMLFTWAFEGAVQTADSMRSRAYGTGMRSHYQAYCFELRDGLMLTCMLLLGLTFLHGLSCGSLSAEYLPVMSVSPIEGLSAVTLLAYTAYLLIPVFVIIGEELLWRISLSRI